MASKPPLIKLATKNYPNSIPTVFIGEGSLLHINQCVNWGIATTTKTTDPYYDKTVKSYENQLYPIIVHCIWSAFWTITVFKMFKFFHQKFTKLLRKYWKCVAFLCWKTTSTVYILKSFSERIQGRKCRGWGNHESSKWKEHNRISIFTLEILVIFLIHKSE